MADPISYKYYHIHTDINAAQLLKHFSLLGSIFFIGLHLAWNIKYAMPIAFLSTFSSAYFAWIELRAKNILALEHREDTARIFEDQCSP